MSTRDGNQAPHDWTPPAASTAASSARKLSAQDIRIIIRAVRYLEENECSGPAADLKSLIVATTAPTAAQAPEVAVSLRSWSYSEIIGVMVPGSPREVSRQRYYKCEDVDALLATQPKAAPVAEAPTAAPSARTLSGFPAPLATVCDKPLDVHRLVLMYRTQNEVRQAQDAIIAATTTSPTAAQAPEVVKIAQLEDALRRSETRHLNLLLDLQRVARGAETINGFDEVTEVEARIANLEKAWEEALAIVHAGLVRPPSRRHYQGAMSLTKIIGWLLCDRLATRVAAMDLAEYERGFKAGQQAQRDSDLAEEEKSELRLRTMTKEEILENAWSLVREAKSAGLVLTIELVNTAPLAMGSYYMLPRVRRRLERHLK